MMFWGKKRDKEKSIEEIKKAVSSRDNPVDRDVIDLDIDDLFGPMPSKPKAKPHESDIKNNVNNSVNISDIAQNNHISHKGTEMTTPETNSGKNPESFSVSPTPPKHDVRHEIDAQRKVSDEKTPPVFIKLDKYKTIVNTINSMRSSISHVHEIMNIASRIEYMRNKTFEALDESLKKLDEMTAYLDATLVRPSGLDVEPTKLTTNELNESLEQLKKEIEDIKNMVKSM